MYDMGLPLIIFFFFVALAIALIVFGLARYSLGAGFAFTSFGGVLFILVGLLLWTSGLQLETTNTLDTTTDVVSVSYNTLTYANNPEIVILSWFFTIGGFVPIIIAFRSAIDYKKNRLVDEWAV
jgi:hypothetical protein